MLPHLNYLLLQSIVLYFIISDEEFYMHTIKIDVSDTIYDNVMFFLNNLPKKDVKLYPKKETKKEDTLTNFFQSSPLQGVLIEREAESYYDRVGF